MEKTIKMSPETAQKHYKELKLNYIRDLTPAEEFIKSILFETFTKEELEGKKGFTFEDSYVGGGWQIHREKVEKVPAVQLSNMVYLRERFKTERQALSALAFSQLSHIVAKYNEGKYAIANNQKIEVWHITNTMVVLSDRYNYHNIGFFDKKDAETSLEVNRQLWEQYWML